MELDEALALSLAQLARAGGLALVVLMGLEQADSGDLQGLLLAIALGVALIVSLWKADG